jgi:hypothetical protein
MKTLEFLTFVVLAAQGYIAWRQMAISQSQASVSKSIADLEMFRHRLEVVNLDIGVLTVRVQDDRIEYLVTLENHGTVPVLIDRLSIQAQTADGFVEEVVVERGGDGSVFGSTKKDYLLPANIIRSGPDSPRRTYVEISVFVNCTYADGTKGVLSSRWRVKDESTPSPVSTELVWREIKHIVGDRVDVLSEFGQRP